MPRRVHTLAGLGVVWCSLAGNASAEDLIKQRGVQQVEFIYEQASFQQCHASTIAESDKGPVASWFGGTREGHNDVGIWVSRRTQDSWSAPQEVATGEQDGGKRYPCWNPVLFQPRKGPLQLYYKVGPSPRAWWGLVLTSVDGGRTWSKPRRLPDGIFGPIKNKPVQLKDGTILSPTSTEDQGWRVHFERSADLGETWQATEPVNDGKEFGAIQPAILIHQDGKLQALSRSRQHRITQVWSEDGGKNWGPMSATELPNPNSGIDAVSLADGRHLLVYNHTERGRSPLNVALSSDGKTWKQVLTLEDQPGEYSYPAVIQAADGKVHITYTWKRQRVRHWVLDPAAL